jgi:hypothetical protein
MKYNKEDLRAAAGLGDETGPPEVRKTRKMMKPVARPAKRKAKR